MLWTLEVMAVGGLLEAAYRAQVCEFYPIDLTAPAAGQRTLLALGDSFSAHPEGYLAFARARLGSNWHVVRAGVSGFSARQIRRLAPRRLAQTHPSVVVVQLYAGNDLIETAHPVAWLRLPPWRNLFWSLSDLGLEAPGWLNQRLGQLHGSVARALSTPPGAEALAALAAAPFDPARFTERDVMLIRAAPGHIEDSVRLSGPLQAAFAEYAADLESTLRAIDAASARAVVVLVPHAASVTREYQRRFAALGARFTPGVDLCETPSPLTRALAAVVARSGGVFVDPTPRMAAAEAAGTRLYRNNDSHLAEAGTRLLGEIVADAVTAAAPPLR